MNCSIQTILYLIIFLLLSIFTYRSSLQFPQTPEKLKKVSIQHIEGLTHVVRKKNAAIRMQQFFPEGACFTLTLYGLSWTNLARQFPDDPNLKKRAIEEATWVFEQYDKSYVSYVFRETQVENGVFWLGQKNLLTAQLLEIMEDEDRPKLIVDEFHKNSESLADAFLMSSTHHIDTYPGMCWPADNVTAAVSLLIHDRLYDSGYNDSYLKWLNWTYENLDPETGLPAGQINQKTGVQYQPARGCANSWILALLGQRDPNAAEKWYSNYKDHFIVQRLGFRMFREYRKGLDFGADVDSGPIIWGAGLAATGIGFAAATANEDEEMSQDIYSLANMWGFPSSTQNDGLRGRQYLFGFLPTGDAFLTWGFSLALEKEQVIEGSGFFNRIWIRIFFYFVIITIYVLLFIRGYFLWKYLKEQNVFSFLKLNDNKLD